MSDSIVEHIKNIRQAFDSKIQKLLSLDNKEKEPEKPAYPADATPVMTHLGTAYMHVWLDNDGKLPQTCLRLRNGYLIRLDQRVTQALAIALLKLPYITEPITPPQEPTDNAE